MITDINNWKEVTKGIYRYVIAAGASYEIHIVYWTEGTDLLTAKSRLFIVGDWHDTNMKSYFERELLLNNKPVSECLAEAAQDYKENMS